MKAKKYLVRQTADEEVNSGEILVVPDQAYSVEEIIDRFTKGLNTESRQPIYAGDTGIDLEKTARADYTELNEIRNNTKNRASESEKKLKEMQEKEAEKKQNKDE